MICVHGLWYVGLSTAVLFADTGHEVAGYDPSERVQRSLAERRPRVTEPELREFMLRALEGESAGRLTVAERPVAADFHLVCVPTPYDESTGRADLRYVGGAARNVGEVLREGDVVVLESTVPRGTTEGPFRAALESASGLVADPKTLAVRLATPVWRLKRLERGVVSRADRVVAMTPEGRVHYVGDCGAAPGMVAVVPNFVDSSKFDPDGVTYIGSIGGRYRGLDTVLEAIPRLEAVITEPLLLVVGNGPHVPTLEAKCRELGIEARVRFTGWVDFEDLPAYVRGSDVCLVPHEENPRTATPVPHKLFQYMPGGKPVVVSDVAPLERYTREAGAGLVVPASDARGFAGALVALYRDPEYRARLGANGCRVAATIHNWDRAGESVGAMYGGFERTSTGADGSQADVADGPNVAYTGTRCGPDRRIVTSDTNCNLLPPGRCVVGMSATDPVVVEAIRTPQGKRDGVFADVTSEGLSVPLVNEILARTGLTGEDVDDLKWGCARPEGEQGSNIARVVALTSELGPEVPGTTVDRLCASSAETIMNAADAIRAGSRDCIIAGGVENMTRVQRKEEIDVYEGIQERYDVDDLWMGSTAEAVARRHDISREEQDAYGARSQQRAVAATEEGTFEDEILPIHNGEELITEDEGLRPGTTAESIAKLPPAFEEGGTVTAANASQISDGASALLVTSRAFADEYGLDIVAEIGHHDVAGVPPEVMGIGPVPAVRGLMERAGTDIEDYDLVELNEAFASQTLYCQRELGIPDDIFNVNGGAIAIGHPLGASGARLPVTLIHEMHERGAERGLSTQCVGYGQGGAIEFFLP